VGGGIYLFYQSPATIINNIIVGEVDDSLQAVDPGQAIFIQDQESESVIEYCNIWGYMDGTVGGFGDMGKGCVSKDPLFVDAGGMDYHIKRTSPCVDAGTSDYDAPLLDYENEARFDEPSMPNKGTGRYNYFDIGMDEYDPPFTEVNDGGNLPQSVSGLVLGQNFPNPFNPVTTIIYSIEKRVKVTLKVYTLTGQVVKTLVDDILEPGRYSVIWDGSNVSGSDVASGVYIYRLETNNFSITRKMILVK
jgi:hypothetical protein